LNTLEIIKDNGSLISYVVDEYTKNSSADFQKG